MFTILDQLFHVFIFFVLFCAAVACSRASGGHFDNWSTRFGFTPGVNGRPPRSFRLSMITKGFANVPFLVGGRYAAILRCSKAVKHWPNKRDLPHTDARMLSYA